MAKIPKTKFCDCSQSSQENQSSVTRSILLKLNVGTVCFNGIVVQG